MDKSPSFIIRQPLWLEELTQNINDTLETIDSRMAFAIALSRKNIAEKTGGPFGAAIFYANTGRLITSGINLVTSTNSSILHAEIVAIMLAQQRFQTWDLASVGELELVTSCEPCSMCLGAICWSGISRVVTGARDEDARLVGFDEGDKPDNWKKTLTSRDIEVQTDVLRHQAAQVLIQYKSAGQKVYNPSQHLKW